MPPYSSRDNLKIVLGGGPKKTEGWLNMDILRVPEVDIVCDLNQGIPLPDNSVVAISAKHLLEHLDDTVKIMEEIWRVSKPGAIVSIKVPYYASMGAYQDPTHRRFFTEKTFQYFLPHKERRTVPNYGFRGEFEIVRLGYIWSARWVRYLPFKSFFRKHFLNIAKTMIVELCVVKSGIDKGLSQEKMPNIV